MPINHLNNASLYPKHFVILGFSTNRSIPQCISYYINHTALICHIERSEISQKMQKNVNKNLDTSGLKAIKYGKKNLKLWQDDRLGAHSVDDCLHFGKIFYSI